MRGETERDQRRLFLQALAERTGVVTLAADADSTTLTDARIRYDSPIVLMAATANAAAELAAGTLHISETSRVNGSVSIVHANNAQADRLFRYLIA